jgi:hypothetical protein
MSDDHLALLLEEPLTIPSPGGFMKCPTCGDRTADVWSPLMPQQMGAPDNQSVGLSYMRCANEACGELIIRGVTSRLVGRAGEPAQRIAETWPAYPRRSQRQVDPLVPAELSEDYEQAAATLDLSPGLSAVMSRSILADLLDQYASLDDFSLAKRIDAFRADTAHPSGLRDGLHHFREIGDFGAHKQKNDVDQIIPVERSDAEWMLDVLDRMFDYFIIGPERDKQLRAKWDQNIADADREPIEPL